MEELALQPTVTAARAVAVGAVSAALLPPPPPPPGAAPPPPVDACAALRCLAAWAEAGLGLEQLATAHPTLLASLTAAVGSRPACKEGAAAAAALRAVAAASRELGEGEEEAARRAARPVAAAVGGWAGEVGRLGVCVEDEVGVAFAAELTALAGGGPLQSPAPRLRRDQPRCGRDR